MDRSGMFAMSTVIEAEDRCKIRSCHQYNTTVPCLHTPERGKRGWVHDSACKLVSTVHFYSAIKSEDSEAQMDSVSPPTSKLGALMRPNFFSIVLKNA